MKLGPGLPFLLSCTHVHDYITPLLIMSTGFLHGTCSNVLFSLFSYLLLSALAVYIYFSIYQRVDEEEYGGTWELLKEGFMTSFSLFLVIRIQCTKHDEIPPPPLPPPPDLCLILLKFKLIHPVGSHN